MYYFFFKMLAGKQ